jgi:hypothetical protein
MTDLDDLGKNAETNALRLAEAVASCVEEGMSHDDIIEVVEASISVNYQKKWKLDDMNGDY